MLYNQLRQIRHKLEREEIRLSDALLIVFRYLREALPSERLLWLNRELLGYRPDDLISLYEVPVRRLFIVPDGNRKPQLEIPAYRFLSGTWGNIDDSGALISIDQERLTDKSIFCNIGVQQLETQLEELSERESSLFSMTVDEETGAEFYCWSAELSRIYGAVSVKLSDFIDLVIDELRLATSSEM